MKIGLTYDLKEDYLKEGYSAEQVAELDKPETIAGLEKAIRQCGHRTERIGNFGALLKALALGTRWDLVFNISEGLEGPGRESQVPLILEYYKIPHVFCDSVVTGLSLNKTTTKRLIRDAGVATADFFEVRTLKDVKKVRLPYPLFAKPALEGSGKGISSKSKVNNRAELEALCRSLLKEFRQPILVERFLPGREFTVGIIGSAGEAFVPGMIEVLFKKPGLEAYSYEAKTYYEDQVEYTLVQKPAKLVRACSDLVLKAWDALGGLDAGRADVRLDENGVPNFIEVNTLPGLNYKDSDLPILCRMAGIEFADLIGRIINSARKRYGI